VIVIDELINTFIQANGEKQAVQWLAYDHCAAESWFKVEVAATLVDMGMPVELITGDYTYPSVDGKKSKADLATGGHDNSFAVWEFKHFVEGADGNKKTTLPVQIARLGNLISKGGCQQAIVFMAFTYRQKRYAPDLLGRFFEDETGWEIAGIMNLHNGSSQLAVAIASIDGDRLR
jgi:hypothetical protein